MLPRGILREEDERTEYKEMIPPIRDRYLKTVVAFANGMGGTLVFGIEDKTLRVVGIQREEVLATVDRLTADILECCEPKIVPVISLREIEEKMIILVDVPAGNDRPYFLKDEGLRDGVYVRIGSSTRRAPFYFLREWELAEDNRTFDRVETGERVNEEDAIVVCGRLRRLAEAFQGSVLAPTPEDLVRWGLLVEKDGELYGTNGFSLLLGDNRIPEARAVLAFYRGTGRGHQLAREEIAGPLTEQIFRADRFVRERLDADAPDLPLDSIRELIIDALLFRNYLAPGCVEISLYDDRLDILVPGVLDSVLTPRRIFRGISVLRNRALVNAFFDLRILPAWGGDIPRLLKAASAYGLPEPILEEVDFDLCVHIFRHDSDLESSGRLSPLLVREYLTGKNRLERDS